MRFDWFTVAAQLVNFVVLVALLKRFLYKPVLAAIDRREQRIAGQLAEAKAKEDAANEQRQQVFAQRAELDAQREQFLNDARARAAAEEQRLLELARQAALRSEGTQRQAQSADAAALGAVMVQRIAREVFELTRRVLSDLASVQVEERMVEVFIARLRELDATQRAVLAGGDGALHGAATLRSGFALSSAQRARLERELEQVLGTKLPLAFQHDPDLIGGVELTSQGQRVSWSIADYLESVEGRTRSALELAGSRPDQALASSEAELHATCR